MIKPKPRECPLQAFLDAASTAAALLPAMVAAERRSPATRYALLRRIYHEFQEMPGLSVTLGQAARLFGLPPDIASRVLERLADARVLRQTARGEFSLRIEEP